MDVPHLIYSSLHWWTYVLVYILAFMSNAAVNISTQVFAWRHVFILGVFIPRSGIAGLYGNIWGIVKLFSRVAVLFYIPAGNYEGSNSSISLLALVIICLFDSHHTSGCE